MYGVIEIYPYNSKKAKVKLENGFTFALYKGEIRRYKIEEGSNLSDEIYEEIISVLTKRARERALYILKASSKTKRQMIDKLKKDNYPDVAIEKTIEFLEKYNYINDYEFAENYVSRNIGNKSIHRIKSELCVKGIDKAILDKTLVNLENNEDESVRKLIEKKIKRYNLAEVKDKRRFYGLLMRNGYSYDTIQRVLETYKCEV